MPSFKYVYSHIKFVARRKPVSQDKNMSSFQWCIPMVCDNFHKGVNFSRVIFVFWTGNWTSKRDNNPRGTYVHIRLISLGVVSTYLWNVGIQLNVKIDKWLLQMTRSSCSPEYDSHEYRWPWTVLGVCYPCALIPGKHQLQQLTWPGKHLVSKPHTMWEHFISYTGGGDDYIYKIISEIFYNV